MALDIGFYHCTRAPAAEVAVRLCAKALESGGRLLIVGERARLEALDKALWTQVADSFLPHALAGGAYDSEQPILLSETAEPVNGAKLLLSLEAGVPGAMDGFDRVLNLFEDGSPAHERARLDWKALGSREELTRSYWQQNERGGWEKRG
ncbi:DNA polymerase III subunit chi [Sandaracinobacter neustonicus]|uniref:DNA polymerase III subunit chi n=1 Tax=Sandaracinobacter neustonicus TaxID=1715348 RepID=UPI0015E2D25F|nr:DNA polymerase III subunit chi [Sandaracinobacter neustonicus]